MELSSAEVMKEHSSKFEDRGLFANVLRAGRGTILLHSVAQPSTKVGERKRVRASNTTREILREQWARLITPITGHADYEAMAADF